MNIGKAFGSAVVASLAVVLVGCSHTAMVSSAVDPSYSPNKSQPIYATVPSSSTIPERQLIIVLKEELCREGFNLVPTLSQSQWLLGLSFKRRSFQFGSTSSAVVIPGAFPVVVGQSTPKVADNATAYLYLYKTSDVEQGRLMAIWEGYISTSERVFQVYKPVIFKNLLAHFGQNYERETKLSKSYLYSVEGNTSNCAKAPEAGSG